MTNGPGRAAPRLRAWRRRLGLLAFLPLLAPVPAAAATADVAGVTTIAWRGTAGVRLRVPRDVTFADTRLYVTRGTYAFVRFASDSGCPPDGPRYCAHRSMTYTRDLAATLFRGQAPGRDHLDLMGDPARLDRGTVDVYLFTDGAATVELRANGLAGRRAHTATGRVRGTVARLPSEGHAGGRYAFGGAARDVGALGYVESLAYSADRTPYVLPGVPLVQPHPVHVCVYRGGEHPFGCDPPSRADTLAYDTDGAVNELTWGATAQSGLAFTIGNPAVRGPGWAGYRAGYVTDTPTGTVTAGWGVWFAYGIG